MSFTLVTITATYLESDNETPCRGFVDFKLDRAIADASGNRILPSARKRAVLDDEGSIEIILAATDDVTTSPTGAVYLVSESILNAPVRTFTMEVTAASGTIDLSEVSPAVPGPQNFTYALAADVAGKADFLDVVGLQDDIDSLRIDVVRDFGADPTGAVDATSAFQNAIDYAASIRSDGNNSSGSLNGAPVESTTVFGGSTLYSGTQPEIWVPYGVYKIDLGEISVPHYSIIRGPRPILVAPTDVDVFIELTYNITISGLVFRGGHHVISIATNNLDTSTINVDQNEFVGHSGDAIHDDGLSWSTILNVTKNKFESSLTTSRVLNIGVDQCNFDQNWISSGADEVFRLTRGTLHVTDSVGVPRNNTGVWFRNDGGSINCQRFRFGGENGGKRILDNYTAMYTAQPVNPNFVTFEYNQTYTLAASPAYRFYELPNVTIIDDGNGYPSVLKGIYFDPAISNNSKKYIGTYGYMRVNGNVLDLATVCATSDPLVTAAMLKSRVIGRSEHLRVADRVLTIPMTSAAFGETQDAINATVSTTTSQVFGQAMAEVTATGNEGLWWRNYATALAGFADGTYTFVVEVELVNKPVQFKFSAAGREMLQALDVGRHIISLPFVVNTTAGTSTTIRVESFNMTSGAVVKVAAFRVFAGENVVTTPNTVVYGSAAPTTGDWYKGDLVWNTSPTSIIGWVCTTSGTPGTWTTISVIDLTQKLTATGGIRVGSGVDTASTVLLAVGQATANAFVSVGQGASNNLQFGWTYNATPASATASIATFGYSNRLDIDASLIRLNINSNQRVIVGGGTSPIGFYGSNGAAKQSLAAAATDAATTQTLSNDLRSKLIALGLFS